MVISKVKRVVEKIPTIKKEDLHKVAQEINEFRRTFRQNLLTFITTGFGVAAALMWNDTIKEFFTSITPSGSTLLVKIYSALLITLIAVMATYLLSRWKTDQDIQGK